MQSPPILAPISIILTSPLGVILNSECVALLVICNAVNALVSSLYIFSSMSLESPAGSIWPVSIKWGAPVVAFLVIVRNLCSPLYVIPSALNSFPSIYSSTIAFFSNEFSIAFEIASSNSSFLYIFVIALLPDLSVGFTISGYSISLNFSISSGEDTISNPGVATPASLKAFLISYLFVDFFVHSKEFPGNPNFSAT